MIHCTIYRETSWLVKEPFWACLVVWIEFTGNYVVREVTRNICQWITHEDCSFIVNRRRFCEILLLQPWILIQRSVISRFSLGFDRNQTQKLALEGKISCPLQRLILVFTGLANAYYHNLTPISCRYPSYSSIVDNFRCCFVRFREGLIRLIAFSSRIPRKNESMWKLLRSSSKVRL